MKFGITQMTTGASGEAFIRRARELGFEGAEPMMDKVSESDLGQPEIRDAMLRASRETGIKIPTAAFAHYNETGGFVKSAPDAAEELSQAIAAAAAASAKELLVCSYFAGAPETPDEVDRFRDGVAAALPQAQAAGIRLALECPLDAATLVRLLDEVSSPALGVYYDVGNTLWLDRDPAQEIRTLGDRIFAMHLKDTVEMLGDRHLGDGRGDWNAVAEVLQATGYDGWLMLETPPDSDARVRQDLEFMKHLVS